MSKDKETIARKPAPDASPPDRPARHNATSTQSTEPPSQNDPETMPALPMGVATIYQGLHNACGRIVETSSQNELGRRLAKSHVFLHELERWSTAIAPNLERNLLDSAAREYQYSIFCLTQGLYRYAFKGLRLVLELCLQAVHLSAHMVELQEWLDGRKDTVWGVITNENDGVFSCRYARAFFPELKADVCHYRSLAEQLYRECSECVHGNAQQHIPLPESLEFSQESFALWHEKAAGVALVITFALAMRYLKGMSPDNAKIIEDDLLDQLGHLPVIRRVYGGPDGG